jgi:CheY-specific phosphatase CheX
MEPGIVDITTSALRAVSMTLSHMYGLTLKEMPYIQKEPLIDFRLNIPDKCFVSVIKLKHPVFCGTGCLITYMPENDFKKILEGYIVESAEDLKSDVIADACSKATNMIAGHFKTEISNLGFGDMTISAPRTYDKTLNEVLSGVYVDYKYRININYNKQLVMYLEIAYESKKDAAKSV